MTKNCINYCIITFEKDIVTDLNVLLEQSGITQFQPPGAGYNPMPAMLSLFTLTDSGENEEIILHLIQQMPWKNPKGVMVTYGNPALSEPELSFTSVAKLRRGEMEIGRAFRSIETTEVARAS